MSQAPLRHSTSAPPSSTIGSSDGVAIHQVAPETPVRVTATAPAATGFRTCRPCHASNVFEAPATAPARAIAPRLLGSSTGKKRQTTSSAVIRLDSVCGRTRNGSAASHVAPSVATTATPVAARMASGGNGVMPAAPVTAAAASSTASTARTTRYIVQRPSSRSAAPRIRSLLAARRRQDRRGARHAFAFASIAATAASKPWLVSEEPDTTVTFRSLSLLPTTFAPTPEANCDS